MQWWYTHTFCTNIHHLHCDPEVSVCTCSGQGSSQFGERNCKQDSGIPSPGTVEPMAAQRKPFQSLSYAACTWTRSHKCDCEYKPGERVSKWMCHGEVYNLWVQKQCVSGPISLQSIPPGTPKLTYRRFVIRFGSTFLLYSSYCSGVKSLPSSSSPTILKHKLQLNATNIFDTITYLHYEPDNLKQLCDLGICITPQLCEISSL